MGSMEVVFLERSTTSDGRVHEAGDVTEVPARVGIDLIRRKIARAAGDEQPGTEEKKEEADG
jgi:hypothetical protein